MITVSEDQAQNDKADQYEAQYIYRAEIFNVVLGGTYAESDIGAALTSTANIPGLPPDEQQFLTDTDTQDTRFYVYGNVQLGGSLLATLGMSYQDYEADSLEEFKINGVSIGAPGELTNDFSRWNPKLGMQWSLKDNLTARAAYFKAVKPVLVSNRTLEPTQIAGFNQFFDDPDATRSTRYGVGLDWRPRTGLHVGGEVTKRDVESPELVSAELRIRYDDQEEWLNRAYLFWTPRHDWAVSAEVIYDKFTDQAVSSVVGDSPDSVSTWTVPVKATYFHPSGWFVGAGVTYVDQKVRRDPTSGLAQGESDFALANAAIGYRFPKRRGLFSLAVQNIFDKDFRYQDNSYRTFSDQPYVSPYVPETTILGRLTLSFD